MTREAEARYKKLAGEMRRGLDAAGRMFAFLEEQEQDIDGRQLSKFWTDWQWPVECDVPDTLEQLAGKIQDHQ